MSNFTITLEIPALERLCGLLEDGMIRTVEQAIRGERTEPLPQAAPAAELPEAPKPEAPKPEAPKPQPATAEAEAAAPATLDGVQRAAAQMRDEGKLKAVTDLFPEFGIKKLSDLKGDALQAFAGRMREMGARV